MRKALLYAVSIIILIIFGFVMEGGIYLLFSSREDRAQLPLYIEKLEQDISGSRWEEAGQDLGKLNHSWNKTLPTIQFHAEMDVIDRTKMSLARLGGSLKAKDKGGALAEIWEIREHLNNLKN